MATFSMAFLRRADYEAFRQILPELPPAYDRWLFVHSQELAANKRAGHHVTPVLVEPAPFEDFARNQKAVPSRNMLETYADQTSLTPVAKMGFPIINLAGYSIRVARPEADLDEFALVLARAIPKLDGLSVGILGRASGLLGIIACFHGASRVYVVDSDAARCEVMLENAYYNQAGDRFISLRGNGSAIPTPSGIAVDVVISNPTQVPLPPGHEHDPFYAGPDGRRIIDDVIAAVPASLSSGGRLLMAHSSVADLPKSIALMESVGLNPQILSQRAIEFRPRFNRDWLDGLGGVSSGLYSIHDNRAYETIYLIEAICETSVSNVASAPNESSLSDQGVSAI